MDLSEQGGALCWAIVAPLEWDSAPGQRGEEEAPRTSASPTVSGRLLSACTAWVGAGLELRGAWVWVRHYFPRAEKDDKELLLEREGGRAASSTQERRGGPSYRRRALRALLRGRLRKVLPGDRERQTVARCWKGQREKEGGVDRSLRGMRKQQNLGWLRIVVSQLSPKAEGPRIAAASPRG